MVRPGEPVKLLSFQAQRFAWRSHSKTLESASDERVDEEVSEAVVVFLHAEEKDSAPEERERAFRHALKHVKWLANKRDMKNVVLHSFTHLGASSASSEFAEAFIQDLAARLRDTGYTVATTPFGWFCEWHLSVYGESLAKVWKEI